MAQSSSLYPKVGLYTHSGNLQLPISSLVEEFKIGKVRLHMMMKESADEFIRKEEEQRTASAVSQARQWNDIEQIKLS